MRDFQEQETYPLSAHAARAARHALDRFSGSIEPALLDDLRIVTSELVSNAVRHSGRPEGDPISVITSLEANAMRIDVIDHGDGAATPQARSHELPSGLDMVGLISDRWSGITTIPHLWAEIDVAVDGVVKRRDSTGSLASGL